MKKKYCILLRSAFLLTALFAVGACGKVNDEASLINNTGQHSANWVILHGASVAVSTSSCTQCHGADLYGGISKVGCFASPQSSFNGVVCHPTSPAVDTGCTSCHGTPPNGTTAPNRQFAHDTHLGLNTIPNSTNNVTCSYCHFNAGFGTAGHANATATGGIASATVSLPDTLRAKALTTTFGYDAASGSCSGVICHGGKPTPSFRTGSITVETDCLTCHEQGTASQTPQYNSFFSGSDAGANLHKIHLLLLIPNTTTLIFCTDCHNTTLLNKHFSGLTTPAFDATAASTIGGTGTKITSYTPFTSVIPSGSCTSACHAVNNNNPRNWIN